MATPTEAAGRQRRATRARTAAAPETAPSRPDATAGQPTTAASQTNSDPRAAADAAAGRNSTQINLPFVGRVSMPAPDELAFLGGVAVLAVVGAIEWPIAVVLGAGHALASTHRNRVIREFGEALEHA